MDTSSITITGLEVGRPFTVMTYLTGGDRATPTVSDSTLIAQSSALNGTTYPTTSYVGTATASSVTVTFNKDIGSAYYLFSAYQV